MAEVRRNEVQGLLKKQIKALQLEVEGLHSAFAVGLLGTGTGYVSAGIGINDMFGW